MSTEITDYSNYQYSTDVYGDPSDETMYGYTAGQYNAPDLWSLMGEYMTGDKLPAHLTEGDGMRFHKGWADSLGISKEQAIFLERMKSLLPSGYGQTSGAMQEKALRATMIKKVSDANMKQKKALRLAKAKTLGDSASYGKMGFRSGESGQSSQYINESIRNSSATNASMAQKARLGFKLKVDEKRRGFVDSLWDLYGDFLAQSPRE
tara:strand:- start:1912 stop:2532 length:621 start_codon:yes stop_codon:yes gene_type:complete